MTLQRLESLERRVRFVKLERRERLVSLERLDRLERIVTPESRSERASLKGQLARGLGMHEDATVVLDGRVGIIVRKGICSYGETIAESIAL